MIIEVDLYSKIRTLYTEGESMRSIATRLGISRQTVKKYCEGNTHPDVRKVYTRQPDVITEDVKSFILSCFHQDEAENLTKQKHTAKRIYDRLVSEKAFSGSYSAVRVAVRNLKAEHMVPKYADIPLDYDPGDAIQIDWGEATVYINNQKTKINFFCGRLCSSCDIFVQAYYSQNLESFLEAQQTMFDYFRGIPKRLIFDNAKVAVREGFGRHAKATDGYKSFAAHYAFKTDFCNIASGNEKGLVENLVGYARRNFMVPVPRVSSLYELNQSLLKDCLNYRNTHKIESRSQSVKEAYEQELYFLRPIPVFRFDTSRTITPIVGDYSTVRFEKNNYSVPVRYLRKSVIVKGYANEVCIYYNGEIIASFDRLYGSGKTTYRLEHYIDLLERKPRSVFQAKPVRTNVTKELLDWGRLLPGGNAEMVKLLRLCVDYGEDRILSIRDQLPRNIVPSVDMIRSYLHEIPEPNVLYLKNDIPVTATDLRKYDEKCGVSK
ncbi:IS21 family transposase [Desulfofalx alkaliphila]|uniref:IS21 family transposase n=1 Tax=Desulfofalx alkaliphila TaxID=105483 RepID=UPI0004E214E8|nr:IS21 family transposase [Desulfofalx alkaliphila]NLI59378.1 IS21 family transposase [Clostridium sp.]